MNKSRRRAARLSVFSSTGPVAVKVASGLMSGSVTVLAECVQSTVDILAPLMIYASLGVAGRPPDTRHPYGHGKVENLTSALQMLLFRGSMAPFHPPLDLVTRYSIGLPPGYDPAVSDLHRIRSLRLYLVEGRDSARPRAWRTRASRASADHAPRP